MRPDEQLEAGFKCFIFLPTELRLMVWQAALPGPRVVEMNCHYAMNDPSKACHGRPEYDVEEEYDDLNNNDHDPDDDDYPKRHFDAEEEADRVVDEDITEVVRVNAPPINLLHVNRESRAVTRSGYVVMSAKDRCGALFGSEKDTISYRGATCGGIITIRPCLWRALNKI